MNDGEFGSRPETPNTGHADATVGRPAPAVPDQPHQQGTYPRPYEDSPASEPASPHAPQAPHAQLGAQPGVNQSQPLNGQTQPGHPLPGPMHPGQPPQAQPHPGQLNPAQSHRLAPMGAPGATASAAPFGAPQPDPSGSAGGAAPQRKPARHWSTASVAALLLGGAVVASATTAVVMDQMDSTSISPNATTSFESRGSSSDSAPAVPPAPGSIEEVASKVLPSVVSIQVESRSGGSEGSGSIFSSDGMIVTNNHVVAGADKGGRIQVRLHDNRILDAKLVAADPQTDIAVIKAEGANDLTPIALGDSDKINVGANVVAIGSPLGLTSTVTEGIVSAKNRPVQAGGERGGEASLIDAIQTDAAINPGNSGGVLVNMKGELVGIPSVIATLGGDASGQQGGSIGLGFAIPVNQAERIARALIDTGHVEHPIIGAKVNTGSSIFGAEIASVNSGSPAEKAGLREGDVVTKVNDRPVESGVGLIAAIRSHKVGDTVSLTVRDRGGDERMVEMTLVAE